MIESLAPANRTRTLLLLAAAAVLAGVGWFAVGIDDNALGILLVSLGGGSLAMAFLHPIRESARYRRAFIFTLVVFAVLVALAFSIEALGAALRPPGATEEGVLGAVAVYAFVIASLVGVPTLIACTLGYRITRSRECRR